MKISHVHQRHQDLWVHDVPVQNRRLLTSVLLQVDAFAQGVDALLTLTLRGIGKRLCFKGVLHVWYGLVFNQKTTHITISLKTSIVKKSPALRVHHIHKTACLGEELIHVGHYVLHLDLGKKRLSRKRQVIDQRVELAHHH